MNEEKDPKVIFKLKEWFKKTSKITMLFLMISFFLGTTGLILGATAHHKTNDLTYFLNHDHTAVWGNTIIWADYFDSSGKKMNLYFSNIPKQTNHDVKWDGIYINGYFNN